MSTHAAENDEGSFTTPLKFQALGGAIGRYKLWDDKAQSDIKEILINRDSGFICSFRVHYFDRNGNLSWGAPHGHIGVSDSFKVTLAYPDEYLISIHGYYYNDGSSSGITSLTFESNIKIWGPFGKAVGTKFSFLIRSVKIVGFHGYSNSKSLQSIGVYVMQDTKSKVLLKPRVEMPKLEYFSLGIYGREDGEYWSENFIVLKQILICHDDHWIISIQIEYVDENGNLVLSKKHGGDGGAEKKVVLEPDEYLDSIEGYYDNSFDSKSTTNMIQSLTVITNKKKEQVGAKNGRIFKFPRDGRLKVVGIHGRSGLYLNAIGMYAAHI